MSVVLDPLTADDLHSSDPVFAFMDVSDLERERQAIEDALPPRGSAAPIELSEDDGFALGAAFLRLWPQGAPESDAALRHGLARLPALQIEQLQTRLVQVRRALDHTALARGSDWKPTRTFAVPPVWNRR